MYVIIVANGTAWYLPTLEYKCNNFSYVLVHVVSAVAEEFSEQVSDKHNLGVVLEEAYTAEEQTGQALNVFRFFQVDDGSITL